MDSKTLVIGRRGSITKGATAESAVTEPYERSVAKDAQNQYLCEVKAGSGIRRGTRNSKVGRKSTGEVDISPFSRDYDSEHMGSPIAI